MKKINTVLGEINSDELGIVLMHEHLYANNSGWWHCPACSNRFFLAEEKVNIGILSDLISVNRELMQEIRDSQKKRSF